MGLTWSTVSNFVICEKISEVRNNARFNTAKVCDTSGKDRLAEQVLSAHQFVIQVERAHPGVVGIVPTDFARRPSHS